MTFGTLTELHLYQLVSFAYFEPRALLPLLKGDEGSFLVGTISSSPGGIHHFLVLARGYLLSMVM